ncbi:hypothetical protein DOTSEDRAFT_70088 [Dothistroma septosporum NZE10]|uniref:Uncharacterized protein n=1 Tax=Dothistroma septosporum (strain NZE10 / CBS 128990) TaxID=675120 RepID=N1PUC7_DOTSN|nr:hypothetical protein DOTSEDRAFT_70088 [Dothistroma septosporum NZE10]
MVHDHHLHKAFSWSAPIGPRRSARDILSKRRRGTSLHVGLIHYLDHPSCCGGSSTLAATHQYKGLVRWGPIPLCPESAVTSCCGICLARCVALLAVRRAVEGGQHAHRYGGARPATQCDQVVGA